MPTAVNPLAAPLVSTSQTTVTGLISDPGGNPATGGTVTFVLSPSSSAIAFRVAGTSIFAPRAVVCQISPTGQLLNEAGTGPCLIWGNPAILPANTTYTLLISPTVNGSPLTTSTIYGVLIFGATYDLSNIQFAPNVEVTPQQSVLRADPVEANLIPITGHVFNIGSQQLPYAAIYADDINISTGGEIVADNIEAKNIAADNITTSNLAATQIAASSANITSLTAPTLNSTNLSLSGTLTASDIDTQDIDTTTLTASTISALSIKTAVLEQIGQLLGFLTQPEATINSTTKLVVGALDPAGVAGQPNLSTLCSVTQYNGAYLGGGASSIYAEQDFNQSGVMAGGNQAVFGISRQVGTGSTAEVDGSGFTAIITNGTVGQLSGTSGICYVGGGTVQTVGTVPGQVVGVLAGVNQSGGVVNGPMVGVLVSAADLTGGTRGNVYGVRIDDQGNANFAIRSGSSGTNAGVNFFGGTVWIASAGNEHPSDHAVFLAGPETGVENFAIIKTGVISQYNGQPKAARENGVPFTVASVESDGIAGNVGITVLVPTAPAGRYRLTASIVVQTQATTSSTIPTVYFTYVDVTLNSSTNQVIVPPIAGVAANPGPGIAVGGSGVADVAAGTNISYQVTGYSSVGAQPMVYKYYVILEML